MELSRRAFLQALGLTAAALYGAGCAEDKQVLNGRPRPDWAVPPAYPPADGHALSSSTSPWTPATPSSPSRSQATAPAPVYDPPASSGSLKCIARSQWAKAAPISGKIQPMGGVEMITVHHEGWTPVFFTDYAATSARMDSIRRSHLERLGAGDIGYHFVIDRAGRLWQGRDVRFQGAHVREHNPHNIGVMCLGNFDVQRPTDAQYNTLQRTLASLMKQYRVAVRQVHTHQELNKTECPGRVMQKHMLNLRRSGVA